MNKQQETSSQTRDFKRPTASQRKRGVGQTRGFFNRSRQQEESNKLEEVRKSVEQSNLDSKKVESEQQADPNMSKKRDNINKKIELGKEFVSKFFKAFVKPERGNIKVTIDETIDDRIAEPYIDRIDSYLQLQPVKNFDEMLADYILKFKAITNIGIAIKLFHSATSTDQLINNHLTSLRLSEVPLPKKMNLILNQLGKTDLLNDNHIRLHEHHLLMKKFMCKSIIYWYDQDLSQYLEDGITIDVFKLALFHHWDHMIDKTIKSVDVLKLKGKQFFLDKVNRSYKFKIGEKIYDLKLPDFNFDRDIKISDINTYFKNDIFVDFAFKTEDLNTLLGTLTFQVAKYNWFNKLDKTMKELEPKFQGTLVADLTFRTLLSYSKIWFLDDIIKPDIMDDLSTTMISKWTNSVSLNFKNFLELENFRFSAFGTDAQLIEVDEFKEKDNLLHSIKAIKNRSKIRSVLKTTEQGAVIGLSVGFSKKVEFSSKFEVSYDGKNNTILKEILKSDFK